jgi:PAS domain S-box-containing protein
MSSPLSTRSKDEARCGKLGCALFEHLPLSVVAIDRDGRLLAVNPAACHMFKMPAEQLINRFIPGLDAEDRAVLSGLLVDHELQDETNNWRHLHFTLGSSGFRVGNIPPVMTA